MQFYFTSNTSGQRGCRKYVGPFPTREAAAVFAALHKNANTDRRVGVEGYLDDELAEVQKNPTEYGYSAVRVISPKRVRYVRNQWSYAQSVAFLRDCESNTYSMLVDSGVI
jgi:hypothetical protein